MKFLVFKKEIICFVVAMCAYVMNKFWFSQKNYIPFFNNYFNDFIGGYVLSTILVVAHRFWMRKEIEVRIYLLIMILASIYWEYVAPLYLSYSVKDANDIMAYLAGGVLFWIFIKRKEKVQ